MRDVLSRLIAGQDLSREQATTLFERMMTGEADPAQTAAALMGIACKKPSLDEIVAAASVMRRHATPIATPANATVLDTCGTGGDTKHTFNISTAAALLIAGCGVTVVKHGNRSASSKSGSADVLEALGVKLDVTPDTLQRCLERAGLCFAFARAHHPAMKHVAPVRQSLGVPTLFNLLGPLTNPASAPFQLLGVFRRDLVPLLAAALMDLGTRRAWVVHADDGLDEISTLSPTHIMELRDGRFTESIIDSRTFGIPRAKLEDLQVNSPAESAEAVRGIIDGRRGPRADIVVLNAAAGLVISGVAADLGDGIEKIRTAIDAGRARNALDQLIRITNA
jgi:anthranilate phosphoribosyltransferase